MAGLLNKRAGNRDLDKKNRRCVLRSIGLVLVTCLLLFAGWSWWTFVSPHAYAPPISSVVAIEEGDQRVFVYGTLRNPLIRRLIIRAPTDTHPATLPGYKKQGLDIVEAPGAKIAGLLFTVTPEGLQRLDRYERLGIRYERVRLILTDGKAAWVYRRLK